MPVDPETVEIGRYSRQVAGDRRADARASARRRRSDVRRIAIWEPLVDARRVLGEEGMTGGCSPYMTLALRQLDEAVDWGQVRDCLHRVHRIAHEDVAILPLWQLVEHFVRSENLQGVGPRPGVSLSKRRAMAASLPIPDGQMNVLTKLPTLLAAFVLLWPAAARAADRSVWPLTPCQVRVLVAFDRPGAADAAARSRSACRACRRGSKR